ncbi:pyridoxamine 5'-phosphate oxidase family protein [Alkalihalobacillus hemicellulosilyticus]|uniref:Probable iron-sulfur binding protein YPO1417 n=1 Tax=Halalkalibacter hemicellulosilyticusJCM 9152 TaxID=1236971 RepID=W4QLJ4_9BACI|nr:pyridoxamine 5'-phosphate oxidase family protein [Halalkalibacter hemicellulosilyticus]GAE32980.1 probable iron-sulfur binding protein YPO1417 [Halalkalibacter hemicellulosilyticusJCM 9152]
MMRYHQGEINVQEKSCLRDEASRVSKIIHDTIPEVAAQFIEQQVMLIIGVRNENDFVWASVIYDESGFVKVVDAHTIFVSSLPLESDPVFAGIKVGHSIGILAIEFATRKRMRVNGLITQVHENGFLVKTREVYSNCPKYIQSRTFSGFKPMKRIKPRLATQLDLEQMEMIRRSDTFFIATHHSESGADASHRGGLPGFVHIVDQRTLVIQDYKGNAMFNTLGNIVENPQTGLLFLDFEAGNLLQINGETTVQWVGSERSICFNVRQIRNVIGGFPLRWTFESYSPSNPS